MLYKFKSQATADVIMLRDSAEEILRVIGKSPGATGIMTVAQIPDAIAALRAEIQRREAGAASHSHDEVAGQLSDAEAEHGSDEPISLRRRAAPFIDMLERSAADGKDVVWGV